MWLVNVSYAQKIVREFVVSEYWDKQFRVRDKGLKELGYESYAEYLESGWWKFVRDLLVKLNDRRCAICDSFFNVQIHHLHYKDIGAEIMIIHHEKDALYYYPSIVVMCSDCHERAHTHRDCELAFLTALRLVKIERGDNVVGIDWYLHKLEKQQQEEVLAT